MIRKFLATLVGVFDQRSGAGRFHRQEQIERELAKERKEMAMDAQKERLHAQGERQAPAEGEILGPSESEIKND